MSFLEKNIRSLLTVKYTLVVALLMFLYTVVNLGFQYYYLTKQVDLNLKEDLEIVEEILLTNEVIINPMDKLSDHLPKAYERFVEIWSDSGTVLYHSSAFEFVQHPPAPDPKQYSHEPRYVFTETASGQTWRTIAASIVSTNGRRIVRISIDKAQVYDQLLEIFQFMSLITPLFLFLAVVTGYILARQALKPIDIMVAQAKKIETGDLRERLPLVNPNDELGNLGSVINDLLDRIQRSFQQLKNFTADASHELRTPLTAMRSVGEVGLQPGQSPAYYREVIGSMLEENNRLTHLVDSLLFLSKADSDKLSLELEVFNLAHFLNESKDILLILAEEKRQMLTVKCASDIVLNADKTLLRRAVLNLLDNAIKYTPEEGSISLNAVVQPHSMVTITLSDTGVGIPKEYVEKVFDRFFRIDKDRSRETGGVGLGLSIVQWVVSIHHGTIHIEPRDQGTTFIIELPLRQPM